VCIEKRGSAQLEKFKCPAEGCDKTFVRTPKMTTYRKHAKEKHGITEAAGNNVAVSGSTLEFITDEDLHCAQMTEGLVSLLFRNKVKIGDGHRLVKVMYPFLLPLYFAVHSVKMENEVTRLLLMAGWSLDDATAAQLLYGRFVNNTGVTDGNVEVDIDNGTRAHFSCERTLSIRGYFYPHPLAEHWNKIIKVFMRMLGLTHTPDEAEKHVLKQMGVANVLRYSYAHMLRAQKAHRHRTEYAPRVAHAAHALLQTDAFLGSAQNTT
jgi:hypothetical protein